LEVASAAFQQAEALERENDSSKQYLYGLRGIQHAEHLRRVGQADDARRVTAANLTICERNRWAEQISQCHRVLGELDSTAGAHAPARDHFDTALTLARSISHRPTLIEALLARGRWAAKLAHADLTGGPPPASPPKAFQGHLSGLTSLPQAFSDLREALGYATDGGYRLYEADIRIALAWAHLASGSSTAAKQEATRAQTMSTNMGYHWGQVDAAEVLAHL
jgi:tetratricopeptide (TPR) repeat protein